MPNRLADTLQQVYYMLPYYMQATGQQRDAADFMGTGQWDLYSRNLYYVRHFPWVYSL